MVEQTETTETAAAMAEVVKSDNDVSDLDKKIIRQVEYYFGDFNLKRDKFMQEQLNQDDGWISLDVMLNFKRLKAISDDKSVIAAAIFKSTSGLMEVNEDKTKIKRKLPLPDKDSEESEKDLQERSVYVNLEPDVIQEKHSKGFNNDTTLDQIIEFLEKFGPTESVYMRRYDKTMFKGSCYVAFTSAESAKKFIEAEDVKFSDAVKMVKLYKHEHVKMKQDEIKERQEAKKLKQAEKQEELEAEPDMTKGALLDVEGVPSTAKREEVKDFFNKFSDVAYIDYDTGATKARLRFKEEGAAQKVFDSAKAEATDGKIMFQGSELTCFVLEGEAEKSHWVEIQRIRRSGRGRGRGRGDRRRGGGGRGGRGGKRHYDGPGRRERNKKAKHDDDDGGDSD